MKNFAQAIMDANGKVLLTSNLRNRLQWNAGTTLNAALDPTSGEVVLTKAEDGATAAVTLIVDELGRVDLPKQQRDKLGWLYVNTGDTIGIEMCMWTQTITLRLHEKLKPKCLFCGRPESIVKLECLNDKHICDFCIDAVA